MGQPTVNGAGTRSDRGARTKSGIDHQEQSEGRSTRCADAGTAGANRSRVVGTGAASQCKGANPPDGDPGASGTGKCSNGVGECSPRVGEVFWRTTAQVWHAAGERETGRGSERGVARCPGAALRRPVDVKAHFRFLLFFS